MLEALSRAREWERAVMDNRDGVVEQIVELIE